jgi:hypothetical protein
MLPHSNREVAFAKPQIDFEQAKEVCELLIEDAIALKNINETEEWSLRKRETVSLLYEKEIEKAKQVLDKLKILDGETKCQTITKSD